MILAAGASVRTRLIIFSNSSNRGGGSRNPAPITTQSNRFDVSAAVATVSAVSPRSIRQLVSKTAQKLIERHHRRSGIDGSVRHSYLARLGGPEGGMVRVKLGRAACRS